MHSRSMELIYGIYEHPDNMDTGNDVVWIDEDDEYNQIRYKN